MDKYTEELDNTVSKGWEVVNHYKNKDAVADVDVSELENLREKLADNMKVAESKLEKAFHEAINELMYE